MDIVRLAIRNARLTISVLLFLILAGALAYQSVPKEAEPDVPIPMMYVSLVYQGISPEDSERLLLRPMETKLKSLKRLKEMRSAAFQGGGYVLVEFEPSVDLATALQDTRSKVQDAKADLPQAAEEPTVNEVNVSEFPVLVVTLSGHVPERVLTAAARELRDRIEEVPGVLEGDLQGARDDLVEVVVDPVKLSSYGTGHRLRWRGIDLVVHVRSPRVAELATLMPEKLPPDTSKMLLCPMPGVVTSILVGEGDTVEAGQSLATVEAMKMENVLRAERRAVVKKVAAKAGASLAVDELIMEFE